MRNAKFVGHMVGCFMFVILAPLGYALHHNYDVLSSLVLAIGYISFGIYVVARALVFLNEQCLWGIKFLNSKIDDDDEDGLNDYIEDNDHESKRMLSGSYTRTRNESMEANKHAKFNNYTSISPEKEKHRRRCSYFFCFIELMAVAASGFAALAFIYQM